MSYAVAISEDENVGSLRAVAMAEARRMTSVNPVAFLTGFDWLNMDFLQEGSSCKDSTKDTPNGQEFSYQVVFAFNKQNAAMYNAFLPLIGITGILKFTDNNGLTRIIGNPKNPVTTKHDADTGQQPTGLNYYKVSVSWVSERPAVVV